MNIWANWPGNIGMCKWMLDLPLVCEVVSTIINCLLPSLITTLLLYPLTMLSLRICVCVYFVCLCILEVILVLLFSSFLKFYSWIGRMCISSLIPQRDIKLNFKHTKMTASLVFCFYAAEKQKFRKKSNGFILNPVPKEQCDWI